MTSSIQIDDIYKDLNDFKELPNFENYSISKFGIIYNKNANKISNKFLKPQLHKNGKYYFTKLNGTQYQIKNLLYNTYVDSTIYLSDVKSKYCIYIRNTDDNLPFINFTIDDLECKSKSDILKDQKRNNKIINKYDLDYKFIKSYDNIEDIKNELDVKYNKYITLCASKNDKQKTYKGFIFRYDDIDEFKHDYYENDLMAKEDINIIDNQNIENEVWKQIVNDYISDSNTNPIIYEISNFGNFRSKKLIINKRSKLFNTYKISTLTQNIVGGYKQCNLTGDDKKVIKLITNVLVAKYFLTIPERLKNEQLDKLVVDHKDHNKLNNHYTNLQYVTFNENNSKKYRE